MKKSRRFKYNTSLINMNLISMNTKCFCLEYNENLYEIFKNVQNNITVIHWKYKKNDFAF